MNFEKFGIIKKKTRRGIIKKTGLKILNGPNSRDEDGDNVFSQLIGRTFQELGDFQRGEMAFTVCRFP